jgi:hypothetical protein
MIAGTAASPYFWLVPGDQVLDERFQVRETFFPPTFRAVWDEFSLQVRGDFQGENSPEPYPFASFRIDIKVLFRKTTVVSRVVVAVGTSPVTGPWCHAILWDGTASLEALSLQILKNKDWVRERHFDLNLPSGENLRIRCRDAFVYEESWVLVMMKLLHESK